MKTIENIRKNITRKQILGGTLAVSLLAAGGLATAAGFSDQATSSISVTAGTVGLKLGTSSSFPIDLGATMKPGDTVVKTVDVKNAGTLPMTYTATTAGAATDPLAARLNVTVKSGTKVLVTGKLNTLTIPAQTVAARGNQLLEITVTWPDGTGAEDNPFQGVPGNTVLTFTAAQ